MVGEESGDDMGEGKDNFPSLYPVVPVSVSVSTCLVGFIHRLALRGLGLAGMGLARAGLGSGYAWRELARVGFGSAGPDDSRAWQGWTWRRLGLSVPGPCEGCVWQGWA